MSQCTSMSGGRRKGKKTRKTRKMRGGMGHGMGEAINPGNFVHAPSNTSVPMDPSGRVLPDPFSTEPTTNAFIGGRRRRKTKKGGKRKSKKGSRRSRKMRGGVYGVNGGVANVASAGAAFTGAIPGFPTGGGTYGAYAGYPANVAAGNPHNAGVDGVIPLPT